jgi:hypothetical protein
MIEFQPRGAMTKDGRKKMMHLAKVLKDDERAVFDLPDGTKMEFLSPSREDAYCVTKGTIPPGVSVPLHSHADAESF